MNQIDDQRTKLNEQIQLAYKAQPAVVTWFVYLSFLIGALVIAVIIGHNLEIVGVDKNSEPSIGKAPVSTLAHLGDFFGGIANAVVLIFVIKELTFQRIELKVARLERKLDSLNMVEVLDSARTQEKVLSEMLEDQKAKEKRAKNEARVEGHLRKSNTFQKAWIGQTNPQEGSRCFLRYSVSVGFVSAAINKDSVQLEDPLFYSKNSEVPLSILEIQEKLQIALTAVPLPKEGQTWLVNRQLEAKVSCPLKGKNPFRSLGKGKELEYVSFGFVIHGDNVPAIPRTPNFLEKGYEDLGIKLTEFLQDFELVANFSLLNQSFEKSGIAKLALGEEFK